MAFRRLADYIERIQPSDEKTPNPSNRPFNNGTAKIPPLLRPRGVNRVLIFPGSFNPPHQGHLNLLKQVFENAGEDLHIIGAIILITDDDMLKNKMEHKDNAILLPREQRANLWRGDGIPVDWAWVYDNPEASWADFRSNLVKELSKDQIELKFTLLSGPDAITGDGGYNPEYWDCPDSITSDISRSVDFRYPNTLRQLAGCSPWERLSYDQGRLERQIRAKLKGKQASVVEEELTKAFNKLSTISICRRLRKPKGTIRFLPCSLDRRPADAPSSTKIREIIANSPQDALEKKLEGVALHPKLLVEYIKAQPKPVKAAGAAKEQPEKGKEDRIIW
ncbi:hypothetical protein FSARC_1762 [Fusarium sarcochroum]|uniref:Cytidyltransferase-like domain-containing protein n=1 Tax=Fusarium sarcochroum TaxID=1208366 RepID=A0A8H4XEE6_9HYPO|nr:hypothetical protein FSARC_1762 [Fusarium sarcochroum]